MKKAFSFTVLLFSFVCYSQDYRLLNTAEKKLNEKKYDKALNILTKAEKGNYGFCGNAKVDAQSRINSLKLRLFKESGNDEGMKDFLDHIDSNYEYNTSIFSIERIKLALKTFSKEELNIKIIEAIQHFKHHEWNFERDFECITLQLDSNYSLRLQFNNISTIANLKNDAFTEGLLKLYTDSEYYKLLTNG